LNVGIEASSVLGNVGGESSSLDGELRSELGADFSKTLKEPFFDSLNLGHEFILSVEGLPDESLSLVGRNLLVDLLNGVPEDNNVVFTEGLDNIVDGIGLV
jgi:hypothetical protein